MSVVLDASALLALTQREPGASRVAVLVESGAAVSAVNWSEVRRKLAQYGADAAAIGGALQTLGVHVEAFTEADAAAAADLHPTTSVRGLSLADRCCLALAKRLAAPAVTAEHVWAELTLEGVSVEVIR